MLQPDQSCERHSNCQARACGKRYLTGFDQKSQGEWRPMYMYIFQSDSSHCILWWRRICIFPRLMFITHKWNVLGNGDITEESRRTLCTNRVYPLGRKNKQVNQLKEYFWEWWLLWRKNHAPVVKSDWGENTGWISRGCLEGLSEDRNRGMTDEKDPAVGRAAGRGNSHCKGSETGRNTAKEYCLGVKELDFFF